MKFIAVISYHNYIDRFLFVNVPAVLKIPMEVISESTSTLLLLGHLLTGTFLVNSLLLMEWNK